MHPHTIELRLQPRGLRFQCRYDCDAMRQDGEHANHHANPQKVPAKPE